MNRSQRNFFLVMAAAVALLALVLAIRSTVQKQAYTDSLPSPTRTVTPAERTPTPPASSVTAAQSPTARATPTEVNGNAFYVSPSGDKKNKGGADSPWPLQYALDQPSTVKPGDIIWLLEGRYTGPFTSRLKGAEGKPITVRAAPGKRAILESNSLVLDIADSHDVRFWGLEITSAPFLRDPQNVNESAYGIRINQGKPSHNIKFINMIIHDMPAQGFGFWQANSDSEIYGCLVYFNGITQFDHGIYVHNTNGEKRLLDNIIFDNASHGIHAYGEKDYQKLNNIIIEGNTVFNNGSIGYNTKTGVRGQYKRNILIGGLQVAEHPVVRNNYTYFPANSSGGEAFNLGYRAGSKDAVVENNYFIGGKVTLGGINPGVKMVQNTIMGLQYASIQSFGLGIAGEENQFLMLKPAGAEIFVRPNQYDAARAQITVYNWGKAQTLSITNAELNGLQIHKGDRYELRNVQDYFEDIVTGTYDGHQIELPMTGHTVAQPVGLQSKPATTFPDFGAFVLIILPQDTPKK